MSALKLTGAPAAALELDVPLALAPAAAAEDGVALVEAAAALDALAAVLDEGAAVEDVAALVATEELAAAELVGAAVVDVPPLAVPVAELPQALSVNTSAIGKARRTSRMYRIGCLSPSTPDTAGECERHDRALCMFAAAVQHALLQLKAPRTHAR